MLQHLAIIGFTVGAVVAENQYISGDAFKNQSQFVLGKAMNTVDQNKVQAGDIVFVISNKLGEFFEKYHPRIRQPYILINHNEDDDAPGKYAKYLDDPMLYAWFAQNIDRPETAKLHAIPIGIENESVGHNYPTIINELLPTITTTKRDILAYGTFTVANCPNERGYVKSLFENQPFCYFEKERVPVHTFLEHIVRSKFVFSPRGIGQDCFRTWEALYLGCIPIVKSTALNPLYQDLPVLVVDDWRQVTQEFLAREYERISHGTYKMEKLTFQYWWDKIAKCQARCRAEYAAKNQSV